MKKRLIISFIALIVSFIILLLAIVFNDNKFIAPEFDKFAMEGLPQVDNESYTSFEYSKDYVIYACGEPKVSDNKLYLYLTSSKSNNINIKARIYKGDKMVGETGLLKPNQYLEYIDVSSVKKGDKIFLKIMGYDEEYHSAGVIKMNLEVK